MALQNFVPRRLPTIGATWLNQVDVLKFTVFDDAATKMAARTALELDTQLASRGTDSGVANAAVVTLTGVTTFNRVTGSKVSFLAAAVNTGATTLNVNGSGAAAVLAQDGTACTGGELFNPVIVQWTGAAWQIIAGGIPLDYRRSAAETTPPTDYGRRRGDIRRYGASTAGTAAANATAITAAITQAMQATGAPVVIEDGLYLTDALAITAYGGSSLEVIGRNGTLQVGANTAAITITSSENVTVRNLTIISSAASGLNQRGVYTNNCGRIRVTDCCFRNLTYGVYYGPSKTGIVTGAFPIPSTITNNIMQACATGAYTASGGEYVLIADNVINDCTLFGLLIDSGNIDIIGNQISGNDVGVKIDGSASSNGDHGSITGNTINHNAKANLVMQTLDYTMAVTGNNFWAAITSNYDVAPYNSSYGVLMISCTGVTFCGNVMGNSKKNLGMNLCSNNVIMENVFHADNVNTLFNIEDIDGASVTATAIGRNVFKGALVAAANNNNTEQTFAPAYANAWVNFGGAYRNGGYWRDAAGVIHLTGVIKNGVAGLMFTLPAGFRPSATLIFPIVSNAVFGYLEVAAAGTVTAILYNNTFVALDGISFKAE